MRTLLAVTGRLFLLVLAAVVLIFTLAVATVPALVGVAVAIVVLTLDALPRQYLRWFARFVVDAYAALARTLMPPSARPAGLVSPATGVLHQLEPPPLIGRAFVRLRPVNVS